MIRQAIIFTIIAASIAGQTTSSHQKPIETSSIGPQSFNDSDYNEQPSPGIQTDVYTFTAPEEDFMDQYSEHETSIDMQDDMRFIIIETPDIIDLDEETIVLDDQNLDAITEEIIFNNATDIGDVQQDAGETETFAALNSVEAHSAAGCNGCQSTLRWLSFFTIGFIWLTTA